MDISLFIVDNFYNNPYEVRDFALSQEFNVEGNYPGHRTKAFPTSEIEQTIQKIIEPSVGKILDFTDSPDTGAFQYTTALDRSWIHADSYTNWAGVCYLTPDAPYTAGTGLFRHKETGLYKMPRNADGTKNEALEKRLNMEAQDLTKWDLVDVIGNKFNRLVLYRGDYYHQSLDYFGKDKFTGRLFQTFFFNTEY